MADSAPVDIDPHGAADRRDLAPSAAPVDADVDLHVAADRRELKPSAVPVLAAISAGGVCGALARYGLATAWPHGAPGFPWATLVTNVSGSLLIGVLMVLVTEVLTATGSGVPATVRDLVLSRLHALPPLVHGVMWSLSLNILAYVGFSLTRRFREAY